jgi:hypothetical protein
LDGESEICIRFEQRRGGRDYMDAFVRNVFGLCSFRLPARAKDD